MPEVRVSQQVERFLKSLAPVPRKKLKAGLKGLSKGKGTEKPLSGPLQGYSRLRVGSMRVIIKRVDSNRIDCIYADHRDVVYQVFEKVTAREILGRE